jgi:3-hydroxyisobutyrate dehydrogenase-like beta-hydroxyacid dehydrogenase
MSTTPSIGFIGFGEAGFTIGNGLRGAGIERLFAYDIATRSADRGPLIRSRAEQSGARLVDSSAQLAHSADIIFSTVTSSSALGAAQQTAPFLDPSHLYADLNSVSPALKRQVAQVIGATGAAFVEVAVMAPVLPYGHAVPMLLGGPAAASFVDRLQPFGMRLQVLSSGEIGTAAAVKMCRSIVVKGLEAILFECVLAAGSFGADEHVFASLQESFPGIEWKRLADYMVERVVVHGERRAREMEEVSETLRAIDIEPIMAAATARRQQWSADMKLRSRFGPDGPKSYRDVVDAVAAAGLLREARPTSRP